jgi:epoxyqueuosine reductase
MTFPSARLKARAAGLGFNLVGVTRAAPSPTLNAYLRWIEAGMHGAMGYLARPDRVQRRRDLTAILPGALSLVVVGLDYVATAKSSIPESVLADPARGRIASYAWGLDYHDVMLPRLEDLAEWLRVESGQRLSHRVYVDTGAILERSHAQQAGLGFVGKNTMLIHPRWGSAFFVGEILTDLEFDAYDAPHRATMCGTCTRCLRACPTDAFPQSYVLDARRCISYHTIENQGWIDEALRPRFGNWVFGCDVCMDVCPFQRFAPRRRATPFSCRWTLSAPRRNCWTCWRWTTTVLRRDSPAARFTASGASAWCATPASPPGTGDTPTPCRSWNGCSQTGANWCAITPPGPSSM